MAILMRENRFIKKNSEIELTILTIAEGKIPISKTNEFEKTFRLAKKEALPTGLITSSLLKNTNTLGTYRIQTAWENQEALEKMRSTTQTLKGY